MTAALVRSGTTSGWLLAGLSSGLLLSLPLLGSALFDDAYIHARIAANLTEHGELAYSLGDDFKASSSTGYVLLLALAMQLLPAEVALRSIAAVAILATSIGLARFVVELPDNRGRAIAICISTLPFLLVAAYGGMETPIACALMVWAALALHRSKIDYAVLLLGIGVWFRFEMFALLACAFGLACFRERSFRVVLWVWPALLLVAFELAQFGSIFPHAALVKPTVYAPSLPASALLALSLRAGVAGFLLSMLAATYALIGLVQDFIERREPSSHHVFLLFSLTLLAAWALAGTLTFDWYSALLTSAFGMALLLSERPAPFAERPRWIARLIRLTPLLTAIAGLSAGSLVLAKQVRVVELRAPANVRTDRYLEIGRGLNAACAHCSLLASEIGGLGFGFRGRILDAIGLVDPDAVRFHPLAVPAERRSWRIGAIPPAYVRLHAPDFVVSMPSFTEALRRSDELANYHHYDCPIGQHGSFRYRIYGDTVIELYARTPLTEQSLKSMTCEESRSPG